jgi:hypothetical protein
MPKLTVVLGRTPLKVYDLDQPVIKIGRVAGQDIVIDNMSVSRTQAEIAKLDDGSWIVRDAGSSNGTFVNGEKLAGDRPLAAGDEISMGKYSVLWDKALDVQPQVAARPAAPSAGSEHGTMYLKPEEVKKLTQVSAQKRQAHLDWEIKGEKGTYALAATGAALIGSDDLCDLNIAGASNHVLIVKTADGYEARNLSAFRGMTINGTKAKRGKLADGNVVEMGGLKLVFKDDLK